MYEYAVALGTFDGLHLGHRKVLKKALDSGKRAVAVTFSVPPRQLLNGQTGRQLMLAEEKEKRLTQMGFSEVRSLDFEAVRDMPPVEFLSFLETTYHPSLLCCGFNYRFGAGGAGGLADLRVFCQKADIELSVSEPVLYGDKPISSTEIRTCIARGDIGAANAMLGGSFGFRAEIIHGDERGRTIGFPTVNQLYPAELVAPRFGVYRTKFWLDGACYDAITNIGIRPTYRLDHPMAETYILDFSHMLYGRVARVTFEEFYRPEIQFRGIEELQKTIAQNVAQVRAWQERQPSDRK